MIKVIIHILLIIWITAAAITAVANHSEAEEKQCWRHKLVWSSDLIKYLNDHPNITPQNSFLAQYHLSSYTVIYKDKCHD